MCRTPSMSHSSSHYQLHSNQLKPRSPPRVSLKKRERKKNPPFAITLAATMQVDRNSQRFIRCVISYHRTRPNRLTNRLGQAIAVDAMESRLAHHFGWNYGSRQAASLLLTPGGVGRLMVEQLLLTNDRCWLVCVLVCCERRDVVWVDGRNGTRRRRKHK